MNYREHGSPRSPSPATIATNRLKATLQTVTQHTTANAVVKLEFPLMERIEIVKRKGNHLQHVKTNRQTALALERLFYMIFLV
jgi:hypothetical protein